MNLAAGLQSTEAVSFDYRASVNEAGPAPLSCTIRAPCRRVMRAAGQRATAARGWPPAAWWDWGLFLLLCRRGPGRFRGELGEDFRKPPTDASPSAEIEFTLSKKWFSRRSHLPCPSRWGAGVCTGPASKSELLGKPRRNDV
jgi:hypothetical protein